MYCPCMELKKVSYGKIIREEIWAEIVELWYADDDWKDELSDVMYAFSRLLTPSEEKNETNILL